MNSDIKADIQVWMVRVTGRDRQGVTAAVLAAIARLDGEVLDLGQSVNHDTLSLAVQFATTGSEIDQPEVARAFIPIEQDLGVEALVQSITQGDYHAWVDYGLTSRLVVTCLARADARGARLTAITEALAEMNLNIDGITRLSPRLSLLDLQADRQRDESSSAKLTLAFEFRVRGAVSEEDVRKRLYRVGRDVACDIAVQREEHQRLRRSLIAFDMDATLVPIETIDEMARIHGCGDEVADITRQAMAGELDYEQSLRRRVQTLKGMPASVATELGQSLTLTHGAETLLCVLKARGWRVVVISGGFTQVIEPIAKKFGIDAIFANQFEVGSDGRLTGRVVEPVINRAAKANCLREALQKHDGLALRDVVAVGDGANDIDMLLAAGLGIAFHAKPAVRDAVAQGLEQSGLDAILYLLGLRHRDVVAALASSGQE